MEVVYTWTKFDLPLIIFQAEYSIVFKIAQHLFQSTYIHCKLAVEQKCTSQLEHSWKCWYQRTFLFQKPITYMCNIVCHTIPYTYFANFAHTLRPFLFVITGSSQVQRMRRAQSTSGYSNFQWLSQLANEEEGYLLPTMARKITCQRFALMTTGAFSWNVGKIF